MSESASNTQALCDGKGWIKNPKNPTGYFSCRGCPACKSAKEAAPTLVSVPAAPAEVPKVPAAPVVVKKGYCAAIGGTQVLFEKEKTSRKTTCRGCGKALKIRDEDFSEDFSSIKIPRHKMDAKPGTPVAAFVEKAGGLPTGVLAMTEPAGDPVAEPVVVPDPEAMHGAADEFGGEDFPLTDGADDPTLDRHVRSESPAWIGVKPVILSVEEMEAYEAEDAEDRSPHAEQVAHPSHYVSSPAKCSKCGTRIECIQITEHANFNLGSAMKYIWRHGKKGSALVDLEKASWHILREIERLKQDAQ